MPYKTLVNCKCCKCVFDFLKCVEHGGAVSPYLLKYIYLFIFYNLQYLQRVVSYWTAKGYGCKSVCKTNSL